MAITEAAVRAALKQVIDPELGVNIVDLGLVYEIAIAGGGVTVTMTMTTPACPLGEYLKDLVDSGVRRQVPEVETVEVSLVWQPPWSPDMISDEAREQLYGGA